MNQESFHELLRSLIALGPTSAAVLLAVGILSWRSDKILKELFTGVRGILLVVRQTEKTKLTDKKDKPREIEETPRKATKE